VAPKSILGLLGPNGAGKTSIIRIITAITMPDSGEVLLNGKRINFKDPSQIGYMPEERGLYKKMKVGEQLLYLAQLKGMPTKVAKQKLKYWLEKLDVLTWWDKRIEELSKGMQQKIQFIATVVHDPRLLILDEPFSGLDPVNANLIKDEIYELKQKGTSIIFSTHRMEQVEEICEDIALINHGKKILGGNVQKIKQDHKEHLYRLSFDNANVHDLTLQDLDIQAIESNSLTVKMNKDMSSNEVITRMINRGIQIKSFNEILPSINDIFIKQVSN